MSSRIEHEDHCPEKGDPRCDCDRDARTRDATREEIARKWQTSGWTLLTPLAKEVREATDPLPSLIKMAQAVTDWIREQP